MKKYTLFIISLVIAFTFFGLPKALNAQSCSDECAMFGTCKANSRSCGGEQTCTVNSTYTNADGESCTEYSCSCDSTTVQGTSYSGCVGSYLQSNLECQYYGSFCQYTDPVPYGYIRTECTTSGNEETQTDFSITLSPNTRSIVNGETTVFSVTIAPISNVDGRTLSMSVSGCPTGATCTLSGGNTATFANPAVALTKTLTITSTSAQPHTYTITVSATTNNVTRTATATLIVSSGINGATCLSIDSQVGGVSTSSFSPGQQFTLVARLRNTGTKIWDNVYTSASDQEHFLGAWNPGGDPWGPGSGRTRLPNGTAIPPNGEVTFTRTLTAPSTPGTYDFQFAIVEDAVQWITAPGAVCVKSGGVTVVSGSPITVSLAAYYPSITNYPTISDNSIYWTTTGNPDSCTPSGSAPWNTAVISPISSGNQYQGNYPDTGTYTYNITCTKAGVPNATASVTVPVSRVSQYTLTAIKPIGGRIVTADAHISCGFTCSHQYAEGSSVILQAIPDTTYWRFVGWGGACSGQGTGNCTVTMNGNVTVSAQFKPRSLFYQEF